jgi:hypothetical protein
MTRKRRGKVREKKEKEKDEKEIEESKRRKRMRVRRERRKTVPKSVVINKLRSMERSNDKRLDGLYVDLTIVNLPAQQ